MGGRAWNKVSFGRKNYFFSQENDRILETEDQELVDHISSMRNNQYQFVVESKEEAVEKKVDEPKKESGEEKQQKRGPWYKGGKNA